MQKPLLLTALLLAAPLTIAQAAPMDAFPADPAGVTVEDRLYEQLEIGEDTVNIYAVMYKAGADESKVDFYRGTSSEDGAMDWKKLHVWSVPRGPEAVNVLTASNFEGYVQLVSNSWFKYVEARAVPVLEYDPRTGKFNETLQD